VAVGETDVYIAVGSGPIGSMVLLVHAPLSTVVQGSTRRGGCPAVVDGNNGF
jgi:hypothetical protein